MRELLNSADKGEHVEPHKITVAQWIDQWLDAGAPGKRRKPVSEKTRERYGELLRTHVVPVLGDRPLQQLTAGEIDKLYSDIKSRATIAPLTQHHLHTVLNAALGTALRKRMIAANPMIWIEQTPSSTHIEEADAVNNKDDHDIGEGLSETELADLISGFKKWPTLYPVVILAASTGCRRGELLALRWKDLDPDRRTIRVERALEETKKHGVRFKSPKTKRGYRTLDLDDATVEMLLAEKAKLQRVNAGISDDMDVDLSLVRLPEKALMFPCTEGEIDFTKPRSPRSFSADQIGFGRVRFHDLRGCHATALLDANIPIHIVAQRIGDDPAVLLSWYAKRKRTNAADQNLSAAIGSLSKNIFRK